MEETPLVSVITPCYNHEKYIQQTIESVVKQTYNNIEYFVIDDGSKDNSTKIIDALKEKYNFHFEVQNHKGLAPTMNELITKCKGRYIAVIESDDVWALDKIEKQVAFLEKNHSVVACGGNVVRINEQNEMLPGNEQYFLKYTTYNLRDIISTKALIYSLTVMVRREIYDMIGAFDKDLSFVDLYSWLKITSNNYSIVILPDLFGFYRTHETNVHNDPLVMYEGALKTYEKFKQYAFYKKAIKQKKLQFFPYMAAYNKKEAIKSFKSVISLRFRFIGGCILLLTPSVISKAAIKYMSKYFFKRYRYLMK